ncbi:MAG: acetate kinase, partial [Spirochaetes bacterium]
METRRDGTTVLVLNCGSSSLKYEVFRMPQKESLGKGLVERIGESGSFLQQTAPLGTMRIEETMPDHGHAMARVAKALMDKDRGILSEVDQIEAIGHRVVHGGERFSQSVVINEDVLCAIEANI